MSRRVLLLTTLITGALAAPASAAVTVTDARSVEGGDVVFTVTRDVALESAEATTVDITGQAKAGEDYTALNGEAVTFAGNTGTVRVKTTPDATAEPEETFTLRLDAPIVGTDLDTATGTIADPVLAVQDAPVLESQRGVVVPVLTQPSVRPITFTYSTAPGTAGAGTDFSPATGAVTIPAGSDRIGVPIPILDDDVDEDGETFTVTIGAVGGTANVGRATATVTIGSDNDFRFISVLDAQATESDGADGSVRVPVTLDAPTFRTVTATYATVNVTAKAPSDYRARSGTVTIPAGQTQAFIDVPTVSDDKAEQPERFAVFVGRQAGAGMRRGSAVVTIADDDALQGDDVAPAMKVTGVKRSGRSISLRIACPRGEQRCRSRVTLYTRPDRAAKARSLRRERRIGAKSVTLTGGKVRTVKLTVPRSIATAAKRSKRLKVRAFVVTEDANDNQDTTTKNATLRF